MGKYVKWIQHKGKRILYSDYSGLQGDEYVAAVGETMEELRKLPDGTVTASITNVKGTKMSNLSAAKGRQVAALVKEKNISGPTVVVGVSTLAATVVGLLMSDVHIAKTVEEAKEWVVSQKE